MTTKKRKKQGSGWVKIQTPQDLMNLNIPGICQQHSPTLLDVRIDPREIPPIERRIKVLQDM